MRAHDATVPRRILQTFATPPPPPPPLLRPSPTTHHPPPPPCHCPSPSAVVASEWPFAYKTRQRAVQQAIAIDCASSFCPPLQNIVPLAYSSAHAFIINLWEWDCLRAVNVFMNAEKRGDGMRKVFPLPPEIFGDRSPSHSFRQESALAGPFPYAQFASVCPRFSASRCSTLYTSTLFRLTMFVFRLTVFVLVCLWWLYLVHAFQTYYVCFQTYYVCTRLFVMAVPRPRFSDLLCLFSDLLCLYSSVCDGCTSSTLFRLTMFVFRLTMFVLVCLWWLYLVHAFQTYYVYFQTYYVCTRLFVMAIPRPRF